jgi:hypothetical protein
MDAAGHATVCFNRANRTAEYLRANAELLTRYGVNVEHAIDTVNFAANLGLPAYAALEPILNLGERIGRIGDRINGTVVRGRTITTRSGPNDNLGGDLLAAIGMNLVVSIPSDTELYYPPATNILRSV